MEINIDGTDRICGYGVVVDGGGADSGPDLSKVEIMPKYEITKGSIADLMQNENVTLAESFMTCDCVVLFDVSGSMNNIDNMNGTRFDRGVKELKSIQQAMPGKYAIIQFADRVDFMPGGVPVMGISGDGTDLTAALKYAKIADEIPDMRFIVISDGEPNNDLTALKIASQYKNRIDTIFIGREHDRWSAHAREFLFKLAQISGGNAVTTAAENIGQTVTLLLSERASA